MECGLDWFDVPGVIHLKMDRIYVDPVSWVQTVLENIMVFLKNVLSYFGTFPVSSAKLFFG